MGMRKLTAQRVTADRPAWGTVMLLPSVGIGLVSGLRPSGGGGGTPGASALDDLTDVEASAPDDGDTLIWDSSSGQWITGPGAAAPPELALDDLTDVQATSPNEGDTLVWDASTGAWITAPAAPPSLALDGLTDVDAPDPDNGDLLAWNAGAGAWEPVAPATGTVGTHIWRFGVSDPPSGNTLYPFLVAAAAGQVTLVRCIKVGSGSCDINVEVEGSEILESDLAAATSWDDTGALTASVSAGDEIAVSLKGVVSPIGYIVVQIQFEGS